MCVGCNEFFEKKALIKVTSVQIGHAKKLQIDLKQNMPGRSFYIYPSQQCLEGFLKNKKRVLRKTDPNTQSQFNEVIASLEQAIQTVNCPSLKEKA